MSRLRLVAAALLVIGAGLFAIGTSVEKGRHHDEPAASSEARESHGEAGESTEQHAAEQARAHAATAENDEGKILGIDRDSTGLVALAVVVSLALAALLWRRPERWVLVTVVVVGALFAFFDFAEVLHQFDESDTALALLAGAVAVTHLGASGSAGTTIRTSRTT